jgi:ribosomal protein S18 acetylase RimI-like enzyme
VNIQRVVQQADYERIKRFLNEDVYLHRHLDWDSLDDWVSNPGFLIDETDGEITGLLACIRETHGGTWIRLFSCLRSINPLKVWNRIFLHLSSQFPSFLDRQINSLAFSNWFQRLLFESGFLTNYSVVVLRNNRLAEITPKTNPDICIRPMEESDLLEVTEIDHQSFLDIWQISKNILNKARATPSYGSVAELDGHLVGYQLSSIDHEFAHLSRLAVLPRYQNLQIGRSIIIELFDHLSNIGVTSLTVNTQSNNVSSLALYKSCGFVHTGDNFPVFELINSNGS